MNRLHALLVGIDEYSSKPLNGCVNDIRAWESFLKERTGEPDRLSLEVLLDEEATRQRILDAFRSHLGQAGKGDTAFFCYSGHGSQELAPEPYAAQEAGGLSETLVAWDSRSSGGLDVADKELAVLIAEVALRGAHVVVILDSCHSGTATRDPEDEDRVRRLPRSHRQRPSGSYWFEAAGASVAPELDSAGGWRVLPAGRHVLLAACEDYQTARECTVEGGTKRGLFSWCLLDALAKSAEGLTYREVFKRTQTHVTNLLAEQRPQAEGELDRTFFEGAAAHRPARLHVSRQKDDTWWLDAGAVHGVQAGSEAAVLPPGATEDAELSRALASVRVAEVGAASSRLEVLSGEIPRKPEALPAVVTQLPLPPLRVAVEGDSQQTAELRAALETSPYLAGADRPDDAGLLAALEDGRWRLKRPGGAGDLTEPIDSGLRSPQEIARALEQIARWQTLAGLDNPGSPLTEALQMTLLEWHPPETAGAEPRLEPLPAEGEVRLPYREGPGAEPRCRRICARLENSGSQALYYALLALDESFAVHLIEGGGGRLGAGEQVSIRSDRGIPATVPDRLHRQGVTRRRDLLVLLVSAADADFSPLEQGSLFGGSARSAPPAAASRPGVLDTLLRRVGWREIDEEPRIVHDWAAESVAVVSVRPQPWSSFAASDGRLELAPGVTLEAPGGLRGEVRLAGPGLGGGLPGLAALKSGERSRFRPLALAGVLASDPGLSVLELRLAEWDAVSPESPLVIECLIECQAPLHAGEQLAGVVWNGRESRLVAPGKRQGEALRLQLPSLPAPSPGRDTISVELYAYRS